MEVKTKESEAKIESLVQEHADRVNQSSVDQLQTQTDSVELKTENANIRMALTVVTEEKETLKDIETMHLAEILKLQAMTQVESKPSDGLQ